MDWTLFFTIVLGSGAGTAIVQLLLSHVLKEKFYYFTIRVADKRQCADILLDIIDITKENRWNDLNSDIFYKAYNLIDRFETLSYNDFATTLSNYVTDQILLRNISKQNVSPDQMNDKLDTILKYETRLPKIRQELIEIAKKLKK